MNELLEKYGIDISGGNDAAIDQAENIQQKILNKLNYASGNAKKEMELNKQLSEIEKLITMLKNGEQVEDIYSFSLVDTDEKTMVNLDSFNIMKNGRENEKQAEEILKKAENLYKHGFKQEALEQYEKAAELGSAEAYFRIGVYYEELFAHKESDDIKNKMIENFEKSYQKGSIDAQAKLAIYYSNGYCGEEKEKVAFEMITQAAQSGNMNARIILGTGLMHSDACEQGIDILKEAALDDSAEACCELAKFYLNEQRNDSEGRKWLSMAVEKKYPEAYALLGICLLGGVRGYTQDYQKGYEYLREAADLGVIGAYYHLGKCYCYGWGVSQDYAKAKEYFDKAEEAGNSDVLYELALNYHEGRGVPQDLLRAAEYYERSGESGNGNGYMTLGVMYQDGEGVQQDHVKAKECYEKAAELGVLFGYVYIGNMYRDGVGVPQDYGKAKEYYETALDKEFIDAINSLGCMYINGTGEYNDVEKAKEYFKKGAELGDEKAAKNYENVCIRQQEYESIELFDLGADHFDKGDYDKAKEYYEKAAAMGNCDALNNLGAMYANGAGVAIDYEKAKEYFKKAADLGDPRGAENYEIICNAQQENSANDMQKADELFELAQRCYNNQQYDKARDYYEQAIKFGSIGAMCNLGIMYMNGIGVPMNGNKARELYEKAVELSNGKANGALLNLGNLYLNGNGVPVDYDKARDYYERSADTGAVIAYNQLGIMYRLGQGVPKDYNRAIELFEKAAEYDITASLNNLGDMYMIGDGVARDLEKAKGYFKRAADLGDKAGAENYKKACSMQQNAQESNTGNNPYSTFGVSDDMYSKAMNGIADAQFNVGSALEGKNAAEALKWYRKAAKQGDYPAAHNAAMIYLKGKNNVPKDTAEAFNLIKPFAYLGTTVGMKTLAEMYMNGEGTNVNYSEAFCLLSESVALGDNLGVDTLNKCKNIMAANGITVSDEYRMNYRKRREEAVRNNPFKAQNNAGAAQPAVNQNNVNTPQNKALANNVSAVQNDKKSFGEKLEEISRKITIIAGAIAVVCSLLFILNDSFDRAVRGFISNVYLISSLISIITLLMTKDKKMKTASIILLVAGLFLFMIAIFIF